MFNLNCLIWVSVALSYEALVSAPDWPEKIRDLEAPPERYLLIPREFTHLNWWLAAAIVLGHHNGDRSPSNRRCVVDGGARRWWLREYVDTGSVRGQVQTVHTPNQHIQNYLGRERNCGKRGVNIIQLWCWHYSPSRRMNVVSCQLLNQSSTQVSRWAFWGCQTLH